MHDQVVRLGHDSSHERHALGGLCLGLVIAWVACAAPRDERTANDVAEPFIRVERGRLYEGDVPYRFVGANVWQAMNLASQGEGGDRRRLDRELDRLRALGITNVRLLAGSEGPPMRWRVTPTVQPRPGEYDEVLLDGLDYTIAALRLTFATMRPCSRRV